MNNNNQEQFNTSRMLEIWAMLESSYYDLGNGDKEASDKTILELHEKGHIRWLASELVKTLAK